MLRSISSFVTGMVVSLLAAVFITTPTFAVSASDWKSGRIADDSLFYRQSDLSQDDIQNFLNSKVSSCDTQGASGPYYDRNGNRWNTRADYGRSAGNGPPYTCIRDYVTSHGGKAGDAYCTAIPAGSRSAAGIILDVSNACGISAKVLIVMLEKEQGLISDDWPWDIQYRGAMGYGCPDTAPCDAEYYGLFNQLYNAARQFKLYAAKPNEYRYKPYQTNFVYWSPNLSCSGSDVAIENKATAGLYNYTPYQPNTAALNNLYGTGDGCSAYGNRNFWRLHHDWFGNTRYTSMPGCEEATNTARSCIWLVNSPTGKPFYTSRVPIRDYMVNWSNYQYQGKLFYGNSVILPGNLPIYRLEKPDGGSFITANKAEYDALVSGGWAGMGIDFYADPANKNSGYPVFRLYSSSQNVHRWTGNWSDVTSLLAGGYSMEGIAFTSISPVRQETAPPDGKQLVYRFYISQSHNHLWTTDIYERDRMIREGYKYEGVAWYSLDTTSNKPVYRLYAPSLQKHLYTTDVSEKNNLAASGGWNYEGISFYVSSHASTPVYRLYAHSIGKHFLTLDAGERNNLLGSGYWRDEGVAWYQ